ncbi:TRAP transporter small permease [Pigmentiphaga sp. NML080357]|uniref:TRAP transporter small permease n=1 Tax=Pigmentiphaga sp. NML080357 TaxID=2008675 RepID=UPI00130394E7|nr:TRAP transporter small permease [Pigmentiphaga sp. NML080357]
MTPNKQRGVARIVRGLERAATSLELALASALLAAVAINVANVVARYVFGRSITGADELQVYLMAALAFFGSAVAAVRGQHLRMDVLNRFFPHELRRFLAALEAAAAVALCGFVCFVSTSYAWRIHQIGSVSENGHIPMWIPHSLVAVAFATMVVVGLIDVALRLAGGGLRERDRMGVADEVLS